MTTNEDTTYDITAEELLSFIQRYEKLEAEKKEVTEQQKEVMAEAKGRGYIPKIIKQIVKLRARPKDDIDEEEAIMDMYKTAIGMV